MCDTWEIVNKYLKMRKEKREFGQLLATPNTIQKRSLYISKFFDLQNKSLIFLGDDDFLSVAISLLNKSLDIVVVDIDKDVLDTLKKFAEREKVHVETYYHNLLEPLPKELCSKFDLFFCDPIWNYLYLHNFLLRGIQSLSDIGLKTGVLSFHVSWAVFGRESPAEIEEAKRKFFENAFLAPWKYLKIIRYQDNFNEYVNGVKSDLFILKCSHPKLQYNSLNKKV